MYVIIFILGLLIGSFMNVCIYRVPKGESIAFPPSHCSLCKHQLSVLDLFPVLSYIFLKGRCRYCQEKISIRYPLVETCIAIVFILVYHKYGISVEGIAYAVFLCLLFIASLIDYDHMIIPNSINLTIAISGILFALLGWTVNIKQAAFGFIVGGGIFFLLALLSMLLFRKEGMGGGDIKLVAASGIYLGAQNVMISFILTCYISGIILLIMLLFKKVKKGQYIPFGPFIATGMMIVVLYLDKVVELYYRIFL